eukprot:TRINITY_DN2801_c2_g1_i1.p1 TRINITY_DN2801_c2_g1~~TRINITY_DN2801_c2_g1_i1.p1  ORF type:complete len:927 (+),score=212.13 TRINITY_DN2801_c2_g1_i1:324-2783(+)
MNYVALHQNISASGALRDVVMRLSQALEGIPAWRVDDTWTSSHLRETMLRSGVDQIVETTGGQGFFILFGGSLDLRSAEESAMISHFFSASAQSAYLYMKKRYMQINEIGNASSVEESDVAMRFGDQHTPLFKTICNTGMPAVHSWKRLKALTLQRRANLPRHHFKLSATALLPFGTGQDGVLLGLSNGKYPELVVSELARVTRRFLDGVASAWRRMYEDEARRREESMTRKRRELESELNVMLTSASRNTADTELQLELMCSVMERKFGPAAWVPMAFAARNNGSSDRHSASGASRDRSSRGPARSKQSSAAGSSRALSRMDRFESGAPVYAPGGELRTELASVCEAPNFVEMAGQVMSKTQPWTCAGQEEVSVFQGALLDRHRTVLFLPLWDDDDQPLGMVVIMPQSQSTKSAANDVATNTLTQQAAQRCLVDFIVNINHAAAMLDAVFAQAIPSAILDEVREGQRSQLRRVRKEEDPIRRLALESMPMWSKRASQSAPQLLLRSEMADSIVVGQSLKPECRQALFTHLWSRFTEKAATTNPNILFVKTVGDAIMFVGGVRPVEARQMFEVGNSLHALTKHTMDQLCAGEILLPASRQKKAHSGDGDNNDDDDADAGVDFLDHAMIVGSGPALRVEFRAAVVAAKRAEQLMSFVTPVGGQLRLDFAGSTSEYVQRVEAAAPPGQGVLSDVSTAALLEPGYFRVSKPKAIQLRGFGGVADLVLVTSDPRNGGAASPTKAAAAAAATLKDPMPLPPSTNPSTGSAVAAAADAAASGNDATDPTATFGYFAAPTKDTDMRARSPGAVYEPDDHTASAPMG